MILLLTALSLASEPGDSVLEYGVCVHCHGAHGEGRPELGAPRLGDLDAGYLAAQLTAFRDAARTSHPAMGAVAHGLTDAQIAELARYAASLEPELRSPTGAVDGGSEAYSPCESCHGADARGLPGLGPDLLYQAPDYLALQLAHYRDGQRSGTPQGAVMAAMAADLDDLAIDRIVGHIGSLRPARPPVDNPEPTLSREEGLAAFAEIYAVATHPRCMNCHPAGDAPYQTDSSTPHAMGVTRFSPLKGVHCSTCHAPVAVGDGLDPLPPADPVWSMPPAAMAFEDRTPAQLCRQLQDPEINGGRGLKGLTEHVRNDHLLITSWHSGRQPPPISHPELVQRFETWSAAGGPCPESR